jgi:hypothetical protein
VWAYRRVGVSAIPSSFICNDFGLSRRAPGAANVAQASSLYFARLERCLRESPKSLQMNEQAHGRRVIGSVQAVSLFYFTLAAVKQEHRDDDETVDDLATGLRYLHDRKYRLKEGDQDNAGNRAEKGAAPTEDAGSTEHHGCDRREEIGVAHGLIGVGRVAGQQHAGKRRA